jgi:plastocyanin
MSTRTLRMICRSLFIVLTSVLFLASQAKADDATVFVGPGGTMQFSPSTVGINVGETVVWKWNTTGSYTYHSVHSGTPAQPTNLFNSGGVHGGVYTYSHTFTTPGTFPYFCEVHTTMMTGTVLVAGGASPTPTPGGAPSTLGNIATRLRVQSGDNALIGGLIATGTASKKVIIRAIGPSLIPFGVSGALTNPTLDLFQGSTLLFSNDDWNTSTQQAEIAASGLAPSNNLESAIIQTLTPGQNYTAVVRGSNGATGIGVVEAFDLDQAAASKLGNISTRGFVDVDDNVMIAGLIAGPNNGTSLKVLVRALGPTLSDFGVAGALANPTLDLVNSSGTVIRSNDNWKNDAQQRAQIEAAGLAPAHDEEAALVETVAPGAYTAVVRGSGRTTGIGLVEAYHIP